MSEMPTRTEGKKRKKIPLILGIFLVVLGITSIIGGAAVLYLNTGTDTEGYTLSSVYEIRSSTSTFVLWLMPMTTDTYGWLGEDNIAQTKWVITSAGDGKQVFAGWAKSSDISGYVSKFSYETNDEYWYWRTQPYYAEIDVTSTKITNQGNPTRPPNEESFWLDYVVTDDIATIYWDPTWEQGEGMKTIVIMNADGSSGVTANLQLGFKVPILTWLPYLLIPLGIALSAGGLVLFKRCKP